MLQDAPSWPLAAIREQLRRSVDVIVHVRRDAINGTRHVETIAEVDRVPTPDGDTPRLRTLYRPGDDQAPLRRGRRIPT